MKSNNKILHNPILWVCITFGVLTLLSHVGVLTLGRATQISVYTLYGVGVAILLSYTGLVPFGASVFFGIACYAAALSRLNWFRGGTELESLLFAVFFTAVVSVGLGLLILRRRGLYFSLLTLACSQIAYEIAWKWTNFTGGENGLQGVNRAVFESNYAFHTFTCTVVVLAMWCVWRFVHSPLGRVLQAVRDNEQRVANLGYNTFTLSLISFTVAGAVVGLAGALLAYLQRGAYASPLSWQHAADPLLMLVLGGTNHFLGALWGSITFILLEDKLGGLVQNWWLLFAPLVILVVLVAPEGIGGLIQRLRKSSRWTLVRAGVPERPTRIAPNVRAASTEQDNHPVRMTVRNLSKSFGAIEVAKGYSLDIHDRCLHSFIGPNGAGKTTFFNMLTGALSPSGGSIELNGKDITSMPVHERIRLGLARSFQIVSVFPSLTVFENVRVSVQANRPGKFAFWRDAHSNDAINQSTWSLLAEVGLEDVADVVARELAHGQKRMLDIAVTLGADASVLLLDEPLAGLSGAERVKVSNLIRRLADSHAVVLIEHDIDRVIALSDRLTVLHRGLLIADGIPSEVATDSEVITAYIGKPAEGGAHPSVILTPPTLDAPVLLNVEGLVTGYGGERTLDGVSFRVREGEAVGLLGRNGVGKTTFLKSLMCELQIREGDARFVGRSLRGLKPYQINRDGMAIVPEGRRLFGNLTVRENLLLAMRPGGFALDDAYALFPKLKQLQHARAQNLSGGERQMVAIARALMAPAKLILLDEPFEGLAPAIVKEVMEALVQLRGRIAMIMVEHHAHQVLSIVDRAVVMVNGQVAFDGAASDLAKDQETQDRLLGVVGTQHA